LLLDHSASGSNVAKMQGRCAWKLLGQIILSLAAMAAASFAAERPNVVFILADDLGYGDLGCYGAKHFETPACDLLAKEGIGSR